MKQEVLDQFISEMTNALKSSKDFAVDQLPLVAKEVIQYSIISSALSILFSIVAIYFMMRGHSWIQKKKEKDQYSEADFLYIPIAMAGLLAIFGLVCGSDEFLKSLLAPRIYLIEYFAHLVHGGCGK